MCKDCGKSFVITTNSIVSGARKDFDVWIKYIDCMLNGFSVHKAAEECGIHRNTAFAWRHKSLDALQNMANDVILDSIVEADEAFFTISYKGNHKKSKKSTKDLHQLYDGRIDPAATLVTDKMNSYVRFSNTNGIELVQLKTGKAKKGIYNIQT